LPTASFRFHEEQPVVRVQFVEAGGGTTTTAQLLVDTGFTGDSAFVLNTLEPTRLGWHPARPSLVRGALSSLQERMWVMCSVPEVGLRRILPAIFTDLARLRLSPAIDGIAGLLFLQQFSRWGAERAPDGEWRFYLET